MTVPPPLPPTVVPPADPTVMPPLVTASVVVSRSPTFGVSDTDTNPFSEIAVFSVPLSAVTVSVTVVASATVIATVCVPVLLPLVVSAVVTAKWSVPKKFVLPL